MSVATPVVDSWDGEARRIYLKQGVTTFHWIEDIYREYIHERATVESLQKWAPLLKADGNNPKGGGKYTPRYVTMLSGTRVVPYDENSLIEVTGEAITDNADIDPDPFDTSTRTQPLKLYITPPASELVLAPEPQYAKIADAILDEQMLEHQQLGSLGAEVQGITETIDDLHDEALGKYVLDPIAKTMTLYRQNGSVLQVFDLTTTTDNVPAFIARIPR